MRGIYARLLKTWCDGLLELQVPELRRPGLSGGLLCPACSDIPPRCGDAVHPLMCLARRTGERRYVDAAVRLAAWSDHATRPDGSWVGSTTGWGWKGITVFGAMALGEALRHHGELLEAAVRARWTARLRRAIEYLHDGFDFATGNINYLLVCAATMAVAAEVLGEGRYLERARALAAQGREYFTSPSRLIFGEGHPPRLLSPRGCRCVDLGYNVEESLPGLAAYGLMTGDEETLALTVESLRAHLEFMLPDGGWDNSWGTRNYKWTYWGSRTSDGCHVALELLARRDRRFAAAARRNAALLERCTHGGLLYGGPHLHHHGEQPCLQHTIFHAKAVATLLDHGIDGAGPVPKAALPREAAAGVREFPEIATWLLARGKWRATVTAYDWMYRPGTHASGGALSLLYHADVGTVLAASLTEYVTVEPTNMGPPREPIDMALTPRLELAAAGRAYRSISDLAAEVACEEAGEAVAASAAGRLVAVDQSDPPGGKAPFRLGYRLSDRCVEITAAVPAGRSDVRFILPVVSAAGEAVRRVGGSGIEIDRPGGRVKVTATAEIDLVVGETRRIFNHVPGFETVAMTMPVPAGGGPLGIEIAVT